MWFVVLAIAATLSDRHIIAIAADGWPTRTESASAESWSWSSGCAPMRNAVDCAPVTAVDVLAPKEANVIWGTEAMLRDLPDAMLPSARADERGIVTLSVPAADERVFARIAGPSLASPWTVVKAGVRIPAGEGVSPTIDVRDADGNPAKHVRVEVRAEGEQVFRAVGDGAVTLPAMPADAFVRVLVWSDRSAPQVVLAAANALPKTVALPRGFSLEGRFENDERKALGGVELIAKFLVPRDRTLITRRVMTDAGGKFILEGLPEGEVRWTAALAPLATRSERVAMDGDIDLGTIALARRRDVMLRVTDDAGRAIPDARITTNAGARIATSKEGRATLRDIPAEDVTVDVDARRYLHQSVRVPRDARTLDVTLVRGASVRARLVRDDGQTAGPGNVSLELDGLRRIVDFDADGVLDLDALPAGTLKLEIRSAHSAPFHLPERQLAAGEALDLGTIELKSGVSITGRVLDAESYAPLSDVTVRVLRPTSGAPLYAFVREDWVAASSSADGSFGLHGLAPGVYSLWTEARGHAALVRTITVGDMSTDVGDLQLPAARTVSIRCTPMNRCGSEVMIARPGAEWLTTTAPLARGVAMLAPVAPGPAVLRFTDHGSLVHEREVTVSANEPVTEVSVDVSGVAVSGRVTRAGRAAGGGTVVFSVLADSPQPFVTIAHRIGTETLGVTSRRYTAPVDEEGRFVIDDLTSGVYDVTWSDGVAQSSRRRIVIPEVTTFDAHLDFSGATVDGVVRGERGQRVRISAAQNGVSTDVVAFTDEAFSLTGLAPGKVHIRARAIGLVSAEAEATVEVREGRPASVELTLEAKQRRERTILVQANGAPVANAFVFLRHNGRIRAATTNAEGRARFSIDANGATDVAVYSSILGWTFAVAATEEEMLIAIDRSSASLSVSIRDGGTPVRVWSPGGFPIHDALVLLGIPAAARKDLPFQIADLPAGDYRIFAAGMEKSIALRRDRREIEF